MMTEMPQLRIKISSRDAGSSSACMKIIVLYIQLCEQTHVDNDRTTPLPHLQLRQRVVAHAQLGQRGKLQSEVMRLR